MVGLLSGRPDTTKHSPAAVSISFTRCDSSTCGGRELLCAAVSISFTRCDSSTCGGRELLCAAVSISFTRCDSSTYMQGEN